MSCRECRKPWQGATVYVLETCPFNPDHGKDSSIIQQASGALGFRCFHNGCSDKVWHDLRDLLEPGWREKPGFTEPPPPDQWPDPESITTALLPVEQLPPEIIPEPFRAWAVDVAHRMQCPIDYIAAALLVMSGSIIGAGCGIRPKAKDDWLVVPNLWGGVIGRPGMLKTPALQEAMKPLSLLEAEAKNKFDDETAFHEAEKETYKAQKEAIKAEMVTVAKSKGKGGKSIDNLKYELMNLEPPQTPTWQRFKTNDATIERMAELLRDNPRGMLLFRDELIGLLASWDKQGREPDRAFYLEAWNGWGSMTTDRIGRGTVHCDNLCVSILGGIQPAKLLAYLYQAQSELENDGLIQRMQLLVYPDEPAEWQLIDEYPDQEAKKRACSIIKTLAEMDPTEHGARIRKNQKIPYFHFDPVAQEVFNQWLTELQAKLQHPDEMPVVLEHLNKYRSLMPSLALIDHLIKFADNMASCDVLPDSVERAAAWCDYLETHARRIYGMAGNIAKKAAEELAKKIKAKKLQDGFTVRDIYNRKAWHLLTDKEIVKAACDELIEASWLIQQQKQIPGRQPVKVYYINPKIFLNE